MIGLGYVGLPLALGFAKAGFRVTGFDLDGEKVKAPGRGPLLHRGRALGARSREVVRAGASRRRADFAALADCDVINVCVPTPLTKTKDPDVSFIVRAVEDIRKRLRAGQLLILGSTTYPGTTHELFVPMLQESGLELGRDFAVAFAPERIDPANQKFALRERAEGRRRRDAALHEARGARSTRAIFDHVVPVSSSQSAEMVKLLENTFRAINIGLANEVALMCDRLGLDVWEVIDAAATKPYGFMKFEPGPGLGGHCIPVDPSYLSWKMKSLNFSARFIELATEINGHMPEYVAQTVADLLNEDRLAVNGANVLVLGVAYKAQRLGPARVARARRRSACSPRKGAQVTYHDPHVAGGRARGLDRARASS